MEQESKSPVDTMKESPILEGVSHGLLEAWDETYRTVGYDATRLHVTDTQPIDKTEEAMKIMSEYYGIGAEVFG